MSELTQIPGIYKEKEGVLLNKDAEALKAYKTKKKNNSKLNCLTTEVENIKADISEIKGVLANVVSLLEQLKKG